MLAAACAYDVPSLTPENYDELTDGKTVFRKFYAQDAVFKSKVTALLTKHFSLLIFDS